MVINLIKPINRNVTKYHFDLDEFNWHQKKWKNSGRWSQSLVNSIMYKYIARR